MEITYIIITILITWLIAKIIFSWNIRIIKMHKLADKMHLNFTEEKENSIHYKIEGQYLGKNILIEEEKCFLLNDVLKKINEKEKKYHYFLTSSGPAFQLSFQKAKKTVIKVNEKIIYNKTEDILLLSTNKIKRIIDEYIKNDYISKNNFKKPLAIFGLYIVDFLILLFIFLFVFTSVIIGELIKNKII
ncbi:MAG TPA: hypothetical protein PKL13_01450 [bacterium]|nr:hypothetical protein [bacterium]